MKNKLLNMFGAVLVLLLFFQTGTDGQSHCGLISTFDAACTTLNGTVFLLSARPCITNTTVTLTILRPQSDFFYVNQTQLSIEKIVIKIGTSYFAIILDLHEHPNVLEFQSRLHVTISWHRLSSNGTVLHDTSIIHKIMDIYFTMETKQCTSNKYGDNNNITAHIDNKSLYLVDFVKQPYCDKSMRLGDFSTLCYKKGDAIYLTALDVCDSPYSTVVFVSMPDKNLEIMKKLTTKRQEAIHIKDPNSLGGECGVQLDMHSHGTAHEKQHITLKRVCMNIPNSGVLLIDDAYHTAYGMVCKPDTCMKISPTTHHCNRSLISSDDGKVVNASIQIDLNICMSDTVVAQVTVQISGFTQVYKGHLIGEHKFIHANEARHNFSLGGSSIDEGKGYLPLDGGEISLFVNEDKQINVFHIMLLRHYPSYHDAFPILHDDFYLKREAQCKNRQSSRSHSGSAVKVLVPIICAVVVLLLIVFAVWWWKKRKHSGAGLPYQIELGMDDDDIDDFNARS